MIPSSDIKSFRDLTTWQLAMDLAVDVHRISLTLPPFEKYELGRQMRRSAVSIPSNVAEGFYRHAPPAYKAHGGIALGSHGELDTQLEVALRLDYLKSDVAERFFEQSGHVGR